MADPYTGQVTPFAFPFAPRDWAFCNGGTAPINQYAALFSLMGTTFGGDGSHTFGLPNLNGAAPCGAGRGVGLTDRSLGQSFGTANVTLDLTTLGPHAHGANLVNVPRGQSATKTPTSAAGLASSTTVNAYASGAPNATMAQGAITGTGGGGGHNNLQPYIAINYCIALLGIYPSFG